ncbi:hypothetical protein [Paenibacillus sp. p3-SID867]|uniref:hypothetical protein n=1 Tax=Paenibacillus sp. p3-SID867 TaxID=2916363 RepID=UPI0028832F03|nr:hypothetical protein [Paenibacillus sp. p3-SID867]
MEQKNSHEYQEHKGNLLIVEDDSGIGRVVRDHLRRENYAVRGQQQGWNAGRISAMENMISSW